MTAKLIITDDSGVETIIENDFGPQAEFDSLTSIESFVGSLKTSMLPKLEHDLLQHLPLTAAQEQLIKKKRH
jgi:hypothetical protein